MLVYVTMLLSAGLLTDYGWQMNSQGELEYIVQIEPELLDSLRRGEEIVSEIPADLRNVRRVRIRVGTGPVPRGEDDSQPAAAGGAFPAGDLRSLPPPPALDERENHAESRSLGDEPPPLLGGGGSFRPAARSSEPPASFQPHRSSPAAAPSGDTIPIRRTEEHELTPIPRESEPDRSLTDRLSARLDDQVRPATASEPVGDAKDESAGATAGSGTVAGGRTTKKPKMSKSSQRRKKKDAAPAAPVSEPRPWIPFLLTSLALFASIGLNLYLGWITIGAVQRYRDLAAQS